MRITFQNASENRMDSVSSGCRRAEHVTQAASGREQAAFRVEKNQSFVADARNRRSKAASLSDIQTGANATDVDALQDYMTVMSHTMSDQDYAKLQEEGFDFKNMDPEEAVTIVDKIKAELVRSGQVIAGYTDDLDMDTLAAAVGSQALAEAICQSFAQADLPLTEEVLNGAAKAWELLSQLEIPGEGTYHYMVDNELPPEIQNFYLAQSSGAEQELPRQARYYEEEVQGYYSRSAQENEGDGQEAAFLQDDKLLSQMDKLIEQAGFPLTEETRQAAVWLFAQKLPVTEEHIQQYQKLKSVEFPVTEERFAKAVANAASEGKYPLQADLAEQDTVYDRAVRLLERYRNVEEVRLHMTAEVNVRLLKSGFSIDTAPIEEIIEAVKQAEQEIAKQYFPGDHEAVEKYRNWNETNQVVEELPGLPAQLLGMPEWQSREIPEGQPEASEGTGTAGSESASLLQFYEEGKALGQQYEQAEEKYEALMTAPRADMGDSIKKAFANVDEILHDLGYEPTEENHRLVRILGYNRMEMTTENLEQVRMADRQVREVIEKMTPASVLKMIRDGMNPLEKSFGELNAYFESQSREYEENAESYSRFLYRLEQRRDITPEERDSYIGIYRLIHQIEKGDGAAIGTIVNTQAQLHFSNLLAAARSGKFKSLDVRVTDELGTLSRLIEKGESISEQIMRGFSQATDKLLTAASYSEEAEKAYVQQQMEEFRTAANTGEEAITMLEKGQLPWNAGNLLAAQALTGDRESPFGKLREKWSLQSFEKVWEKLEEKEAFQEEFSQAVEETKEAVEEAGLSREADSVDVREFRLLHKQLTITAALSRQEEYILPMDLDGQPARVHLTFRQGEEEKGIVSIVMDFSKEEHIEANLQLREGKVSGFLLGNSPEEVMKLQRTVDIFSSQIKEDASFSMDAQLSIVDTADKMGIGRRAAGRNNAGTAQRVRTAAAEAPNTVHADNRELYRMAKMFLQAAKDAITRS
ncbi:MAG: DUF6240 domain-containing protein [Roseburia sp.]|nr:DUF6240 domain-containing protein [Roseburia sp.]